jgi:hypothetical protein
VSPEIPPHTVTDRQADYFSGGGTNAGGSATASEEDTVRKLICLFALTLGAAVIGAQTVYYEFDKRVSFEVESAPQQGWTRETTFSGYTGSCYYRWNGSSSTGSPSGPENELVYRFVITNEARYQVNLHSRHETDNDQENDTWIAIDDGAFTKIAAVPGRRWTWHTRTDHGSYTPTISAGEHTLRLRPRSHGYAVDRIVLYSTQLPYGYEIYQEESPTTMTPPMPRDVYVYPATGFDYEGKGYSASGPFLQLNPPTTTSGSADMVFSGHSGRYHIDLIDLGENKGGSKFRLTVGTQSFDYTMPTSWVEREGKLDYLWFIPDVAVDSGDQITVEGTSVNGTLAAFGKLILVSSQPSLRSRTTPMRPLTHGHSSSVPRGAFFTLTGREFRPNTLSSGPHLRVKDARRELVIVNSQESRDGAGLIVAR